MERAPEILPNTTSRLIAMALLLVSDEEVVRRSMGASAEDFTLYREGKKEPPWPAFDGLVELIVSRQRERMARTRVRLRAAATLQRSTEIRGRLLESATMQMRSDAASLQLLDTDKKELLLLGWKGFHPDSAAYWQRVPCGNESTCGVALKERQRVIVPDVNDPTFGLTEEGIAYYKRSGLVAVQSTPLVSRDGRLLGMMSTHWRRLYHPMKAELALFDVLAHQAADLLDGTIT